MPPKVGGGGVKFRHFGKHAYPRVNVNPNLKQLNDTYNNVASHETIASGQSTCLNTNGSVLKNSISQSLEKNHVPNHHIENHDFNDDSDNDEEIMFVKPTSTTSSTRIRNGRLKRRSGSDWKPYSDFSYTNSPESEWNEYLEPTKSSPSDLSSKGANIGSNSQTYRTRKSTGSIKGDGKFVKWEMDDQYENNSETKEFQLRPKKKMKKNDQDHDLSYLSGIIDTDAASDKVLKLLWINTCKEFYSQMGPKHLESIESLHADCSDENVPVYAQPCDSQATTSEIVRKNDTKFGVIPAPLAVLQLSKLGNVAQYDQHATLVNEIISNRGGFDEYTHRMLQMVKVKDFYSNSNGNAGDSNPSNGNAGDSNPEVAAGEKDESQNDTAVAKANDVTPLSASRGSKKSAYPLEIDWKEVDDHPLSSAYNGFDKIDLGKRGRWYKDVWNEEDFFARSKQRTSIYSNHPDHVDLYPLDDWSELLHNYNDDFDGNYLKWLTYVTRDLDLSKNAPIIVTPPVPSAVHHPAAWGLLHKSTDDGKIDTNCIHPASVRRAELPVNHQERVNIDEINIVANSAWALLQDINKTNQKKLESLEKLVQNEQNIGSIRVKKRFLGKILMSASFGQKEYHAVVMKGYSPTEEYYNYRRHVALLDYKRSLGITTDNTDVAADELEGINEKMDTDNNELNNKYNLGFGANGVGKFSYDHIHRHSYETRRTTNSLKKKSHDEYIVDESLGKNNEMEVVEKPAVVYRDMLGACLVDDVPHGSFVFKLRLGDFVEVYITSSNSWTLGRVMKLGIDDGSLLRHTKIKVLSSDESHWISVEDGRLAPPGTNLPAAASNLDLETSA
jgi:hypothetical protein